MLDSKQKLLTYADIAADNPRIEQYVQQLRPERNPRRNPWLRYSKAKRDLAPLIPKLPGAYDAVLNEVIRRLQL